MLRRFQEGFAPGKTVFFDDLFFCVQIFAHLRWFELQMTWVNYSELSPGHPAMVGWLVRESPQNDLKIQV